MRSWLLALLADMKGDQQLQAQATANSREQFLASNALRDKLLIAVAMNQTAQARMAELINQKSSIEDAVLRPLGELLYAELQPAAPAVDVARDADPTVELDRELDPGESAPNPSPQRLRGR